MMVNLVVLVLAFAVFDSHNRVISRKAMIRNLSILADLVGERSAQALLDDDADAGRAALSALDPHISIQHARLFKDDGTLFTDLQRDDSVLLLGDTSPHAEGYRFEGDYLLLSRPIIVNGEAIGTVFLQQVTDKLQSRMTRYAGVIALAMVFTFLLALPISSQMSKWASGQRADLKNTPRLASEPPAQRYPLPAPIEKEETIVGASLSKPPDSEPTVPELRDTESSSSKPTIIEPQAAEPPVPDESHDPEAIVVEPSVSTFADSDAPVQGSLSEKRTDLSILLAEDNPVNQRVASIALQKRGHRVTIAETGKQVLDALDNGSYDLILMDVQMPEVSGNEATEAIRKKETQTGGHIPIIAMTAHTKRDNKDACLAAGMDDYISKPIKLDDLFDAITRFLPEAGSSEKEPALSDSTPHPDFDKHELLDRVEGDLELLEEIVVAFIKDYPDKMSEIREVIVDGKAADLQRLAHSFKGSVGIFSKGKTFENAKLLEMCGSEGDLTKAPQILDELEENLKVLERDLEKLLAESVPQQS